jgi:hypothetical protein
MILAMVAAHADAAALPGRSDHSAPLNRVYGFTRKIL